MTVRVDRPGVLLRDLHTVGGGMSAKDTVTTADGGKRSGATGTLLSHRMYLADAAFTVAVTTAAPKGPAFPVRRCRASASVATVSGSPILPP